WASKCAKSVGELALELVDYYALFDPMTTAISIQHGLTDIKQDAKFKDRPKLNVGWTLSMAISSLPSSSIPFC
uniref:Dynein light chain n=1 Tax=Globodera pallida TaxID=36090 RepID=A0A183CSK1_GLOPA